MGSSWLSPLWPPTDGRCPLCGETLAGGLAIFGGGPVRIPVSWCTRDNVGWVRGDDTTYRVRLRPDGSVHAQPM